MLWSDIGQENQPGFIDTSTGVFTPDPKGSAALQGHQGANVTSAWASYDAAQHRWLPVPRDWVSPDGSKYAYGDDKGIHVVDVSTGADSVVPGTVLSTDPRGAHYFVIAYQPDAIYVSQASQISGGGIWLLDPAKATLKQVSTDATGAGIFVSGAQAWWTTNPNAASPDPYVYHQPLTGVAGQHGETWFSRDGYTPYVLGVAPGQAMVVVHAFAGDELWILATPDASHMVASAPDLSGNATVVPFRTAVEDASGWWIGGKNDVFFTNGSTLQTVSSTPAVVVGACQAGG